MVAPEKMRRTSSHVDTRPDVPSRYRYNPVSVEWQHRVCQQLGLCFVCANKTTTGGPDVHPASVHKVRGDGNCLFCALCYIIRGSERQHFKLRSLIVEHLRSNEACMRLLGNYIGEPFTEYIEDSQMDQTGMWGTTTEMLALAHMLEVNSLL